MEIHPKNAAKNLYHQGAELFAEWKVSAHWRGANRGAIVGRGTKWRFEWGKSWEIYRKIWENTQKDVGFNGKVNYKWCSIAS